MEGPLRLNVNSGARFVWFLALGGFCKNVKCGRFTIFTDGPDIEDIVNKFVKENPLLHRKEMVLYIGLRTFGRHASPPDFASVERALLKKFQDCVVRENTTLLR